MLPSLGVLIAARNAAPTIGRAIASALREVEVGEVVLVDDASSDGTAAVAAESANGDPRLRIVRLDINRGPAQARNLGLGVMTADAVAILDGDDQFLPHRFAPLLAQTGWDLIADNIVFVTDPDVHQKLPVIRDARFETLTLGSFAGGNIARRGRSRGEYGFLKPLLSREFLRRHGLRYDETLRLGEDYDLYARALMAGARFLLTRRPGYLALVRSDSLSSHHRTEDLGALARVMQDHLAHDALSRQDRDVLRRLLRQVEGRHAHRAILDAKASHGLSAVARQMLRRPSWFLPVAARVAQDKLFRAKPPIVPPEGYRLLLPAS